MLHNPTYRINSDVDAYHSYKKFKLFPKVSEQQVNPITETLAKNDLLVEVYKAACEFYQDKAIDFAKLSTNERIKVNKERKILKELMPFFTKKDKDTGKIEPDRVLKTPDIMAKIKNINANRQQQEENSDRLSHGGRSIQFDNGNGNGSTMLENINFQL